MKEQTYYKNIGLALATALVMTACGGGGSDANATQAPTETTDITHNGTTYDTVTSTVTGRIWLDRNLGAARVCTSSNDTACYGDYYQWGRNFDGHQDSMSGDVTTQASDVNNAGDKFIATEEKDWVINGIDNNKSLRAANWSKTDGSSVCPTGFRVPTLTELSAETLDQDVNSSATAFSNFLKLPSAGLRSGFNGDMYAENSGGSLWTSSVYEYSPTSIFPRQIGFDSVRSYVINSSATGGKSVRCIKN